MHDYMRVVASVDRNVGRVIDYLRKHDLLDNTLIVYTSDQGFYMGEHGWFDKRFMYEESFRTPLLMYLPGGKHGDVKEMVQNIDYAPTFLELAGVPVPKDNPGDVAATAAARQECQKLAQIAILPLLRVSG